MEKIRLDISGMSYSQSQTGAYALILAEREGGRRLPIIIGGFEAQAIAIELEKIKTPRPLTHDLFKTFAKTFLIDLDEVIISKFSEGVFFATLVCRSGDTVHEIDSRTSDAIALAIRFQCPIYTYEHIIATAGMLISEEKELQAEDKQEVASESEPADDFLGDKSEEELQELLHVAIDHEEYERASLIRDELNKRKSR